MSKYNSGACNINQVESKKRLATGIAGFLNSAILIVVLFFFPKWILIYPALFLLSSAGFAGYLQYKNNFCAGLALKKKFKIGEEEEKVSNPEKVSEDRKKALGIIFQSLMYSSLLILGVYLALGNF
ncbi:MAG: hypothetical protein V5A72_00295 [Candidatus Nanohaloarchaea archaeon]